MENIQKIEVLWILNLDSCITKTNKRFSKLGSV